ncbi:MAG: ABC-F family ATP-binding cassette domain-containing protein, partial [Myxococcota bacterium]|nr:ABC-F family ATP-binding cassette domain-containing protein [Myxococcota bacterium]
MGENVISLVGLDKRFGERLILDDVTLGFERGQHIGLIGANGAGKSTLMKIIASLEPADGGEVVLRNTVKLHFLHQDPPLADTATAREVLQARFLPLIDAIAAYEQAVMDMDDAAEVLLERIESLGGWDWQHRLDRAASSVGLVDVDQVIGTMSGGQKKRVALAEMVLSGADILLLDEPTNHLDPDTIDWLEDWLQHCDGTVILVTHDRYFLDRVVTHMVELREGRLRTYPGNYTEYLVRRTEEDDLRARTRKRRLQVLKAELEWARRSPKARTTKQKARLSRIDDQQSEVRRLRAEDEMEGFRFGTPPRLGKTILELVSVTKTYGGLPTLIDRFSLIVRRGERLGVIGPNGCGKTTLLKLIADTLEPDSGTVTRGTNTKIAWFDQNRAFLDPNETVRATVTPEGGDYVFMGDQKIHVVGWLQRFSFPTQTHNMKVGSLSGGEQNRLAICRFLLTDANVLLLDEPTNDLDIMTMNLLEAALVEFQGCVLVVSHDRYFLDKVSTGIIAFEPDPTGETTGRVTTVQGDWTHYQRIRLKELEAEKQRAKDAREAERKARAAAPKPTPVKRGLSYREKQEFDGIEAAIEAAEAQV